MIKNNVYRLLAVFIGLTMSGAFMLCELGVNFTPLTKLFIIFFCGIVGLQCVPAALLFVSLVKGVFTVNPKHPLAGNGVKS